MLNFRRALVVLCIAFALAAPSVAAKGGGHGSGRSRDAAASGPKTVHVKGHTKPDGMYVASSHRSAPTISNEPKRLAVRACPY